MQDQNVAKNFAKGCGGKCALLASLRQLRVIKTAVDLREGSHTVKAEYQELRNSKPPSKRLNLSPMDPKQPPPILWAFIESQKTLRQPI